jgi:hypothetical protein
LGGIALALSQEGIARISALENPDAEVGAEKTVSLPALLAASGPWPGPVHAAAFKEGAGQLLLPKIVTDMDIPDDILRPLPEPLPALLPWFRGLFFTEKDMFLLLDEKKIVAGGRC